MSQFVGHPALLTPLEDAMSTLPPLNITRDRLDQLEESLNPACLYQLIHGRVVGVGHDLWAGCTAIPNLQGI